MNDTPYVESERNHFDDLASQRRSSGFIPDLRRMGDNAFFYLSPYRRQRLAQISLTRISGFATEQLTKVLPQGGAGVGPGLRQRLVCSRVGPGRL